LAVTAERKIKVSHNESWWVWQSATADSTIARSIWTIDSLASSWTAAAASAAGSGRFSLRVTVT
jgi:hypothetical protein